MNATQAALTALTVIVLASTPVHAEGEPGEPESDPCPAIQVRPYGPFVSFHPDCLGDTMEWLSRQG